MSARSRPGELAIVGMACVFPGAPDLATYWRNLADGHDAVTEVPAGRWEDVFYEPESASIDRVYCRRGGFIAEPRIDPLAYGLMPATAATAEPDQMLTLQVAARALADAGYDHRPFPRERTGIILGRGGYLGVGLRRYQQHARGAEQVVSCLRALLPDVAEAELRRVKAEFQEGSGPCGTDGAAGVVPNLGVSRVAHWLDLHGPAHTVDAACASALVALDQAGQELERGRCDMMLAGAVHVGVDATFWSVFCQVGAMSRAERIRPFDRRADGLLAGEGIGLVVLKRHADARRDGDRVYAVIRGIGVSSDGRGAGLMSPRVEGQLIALERAWTAARVDPATIGLLEAHGTATPAGDVAELSTLARFFGPATGRPRAVLGSVKSMIGHAMPAAGAAGLIKAALAVHHRTLLPTLHCEEPHEQLALTRFRTIGRAEPWEGRGRRRAAVSAFGFGGINAHVVLESPAGSGPRSHVPAPASRPATEAPPSATRPAPLPALLTMAAASRGELADALREAPSHPAPPRSAGSVRLALLDPSLARRARALEVIQRGEPWRGHDGIWFSPRGLGAAGGRVAILFPGIDAARPLALDDVAARVDAGSIAPAGAGTSALEQGGMEVIRANRIVFRALGRMGVKPDVVAGHSIGEWSAMIASGLLAEESVDAFLEAAAPGRLRVPGLVFAAVGGGAAQVAALLGERSDLCLSHDNCPHQVILCGREEAVKEACAALRGHGLLCHVLPFRSGFHSRFFEPYLAPHRHNIARFPLRPPATEVWSSTTCARFPDEPDEVRALMAEHLVRPVRFRELVEALYGAGVRLFVQAGAGSLPSFVEDTLRGRPHHALAAASSKRSALAQLQRLGAALFVEGLELDLTLFSDRPPAAVAPALRLALGVPLVPVRGRLGTSSAPVAPSSDPVLVAFAAGLADIAAAEAETRRAWEAARGRELTPPAGALGPPLVRRRVLSIETAPYLADHCFYPQPPGWPNLADRRPVVPMTTLIALMIEAAAELAPGRVAVAVEHVRSDRWLEVVPPAEVEVRAHLATADRVHVAIGDDAEGTVVLADARPPRPPFKPGPLAAERPARLAARQLYTEGWMFHGPAFQTVVELGRLGHDGLRGTVVAGGAPGSLLDGAGQLVGYWVQAQAEEERLAMPVGVERVELFGLEPPVGQRLEAFVRIRRLEPGGIWADMELADAGAVAIRVTGWHDRRFEFDDRLWPVLRGPERHLLSTIRPEGYSLFHDTYRSAFTRDYLSRRFLGEQERAALDAVGPRRRRSWMAGRVAAKDAVRALLWRRGCGPVFPVEIAVWNEPGGRPRVRAPFLDDVRLSIAHTGELAVALASEGRDVGIDVERVEARPPEFWDVCFTAGERRAIEATEDPIAEATRLFAAKEAVAKSRGEGLGGNPRRLEMTDRDGGALEVGGRRVESRREGDCVVCWTVA